MMSALGWDRRAEKALFNYALIPRPSMNDLASTAACVLHDRLITSVFPRRNTVGLRGLWATPRKEGPPFVVTRQALKIYKRMRAHEREQGGPGDDEWWAMNRELARCFGLFEGMVVFEDPQWGHHRPMQSAIDRFFELERAARPKRKFR